MADNKGTFGIRKDERVALFIDGPNLYAATRTLGWEVDFKKLRKHFGEECHLKRVYYYTAILEDDTGRETVRPLLDWLAYNGFQVRTKAAKEFSDQTGRRKIKGNTDVEMTVDMLLMADHVDHMILFTGDGDFEYAIEAIQAKGPKVTVVSTKETDPPMVADELRRVSDNFVDLVTVEHIMSRGPAPGPGGTTGGSGRTSGGSHSPRTGGTSGPRTGVNRTLGINPRASAY